LLKENENSPSEISFKGINVSSNAIIQLIGSNQKLNWKKEGETIHVFLPKKISSQHAIVLKIIL